jgi:hypothetical protein
VRRIRYTTSRAPKIGTQPASARVAVGDNVTFNIVAYSTDPPTYQWQRSVNGQTAFATIPGANATAFNLTAVTLADSGSDFRCIVANSSGSVTSNPARLTVIADTPPTPFISAPVEGTTFKAGDTFAFSGFGTDLEDGRLAPSKLVWRVDFQHHDHSHPFIPDTRGVEGGSFTIPTTGETSDDVWYRIYLTATDSQNISRTSYRDILPQKAAITLTTVPPGLELLLDGTTVRTPHIFVGVAGIQRTIEARSQIGEAGVFEFLGWSDGGAPMHAISTPGRDTTFTATFRNPNSVRDSAEFISISVTNRVVGGMTFPVTVVMKNNGNTTWSSSNSYHLATILPPDNITWGFNPVPIPGTIAPGEMISLTFVATAPNSIGTNETQWQMVRDGFYLVPRRL